MDGLLRTDYAYYKCTYVGASEYFTSTVGRPQALFQTSKSRNLKIIVRHNCLLLASFAHAMLLLTIDSFQAQGI